MSLSTRSPNPSPEPNWEVRANELESSTSSAPAGQMGAVSYPAESNRNGHIALLTSARGIAALWVLAHNDGAFRSTIGIDAVTQFLAKGYLAVDFFLILSGFILTYVHRGNLSSFSATSYLQFISLRLARIYPLYLFLLCARVGIETVKALTGMSGSFLGPEPFTGTNSPSALAVNAVMLQAWGVYEEPTWVPSFWSVSAEWFAYLWFPLLLLALLKPSRTAWGTVFIAILCVATLAIGIQGFGKLEFPVNFSLVRCMPEFIIGMLLAMNLCNPSTRDVLASRKLAIGGVAVTLLAIVSTHFGWHDLIFVGCACVLIPLAANIEPAHSFVAKVLANPWLVYLGKISYAIYLSHIIIQSVFRVLANKLFGEASIEFAIVLFFVRGVLIIGISALLYHWVEVPARDFIRKRVKRQEPQAA